MSEVKHMESNIINDMEYYAAYYFLYDCLIYPDKFENGYSINPNDLIN